MESKVSRNPNRPAKGSFIKGEPIREGADIARIRGMLDDNPRNWALFVFGINTGLRASELVSIRIGDVAHLKEGDALALKEPKTGKVRRITLNGLAIEAVRRCIAAHPTGNADDILFWSKKTKKALLVSSVCRLVKKWCADAGVNGHFGSHSLRRTWGYQNRVQHGEALSLLSKAFGHSSEAQTLEYLCIQPAELQRLYRNKI